MKESSDKTIVENIRFQILFWDKFSIFVYQKIIIINNSITRVHLEKTFRTKLKLSRL